MIPLWHKWAAMIDLTSHCGKGCTYCIRNERHLRQDQRFFLTLNEVERALQSFRGWPTKVGLTGGDPLLHPEFDEVCRLFSAYIPKSKAGVFTSHAGLLEKHRGTVDATFGEVYVNLHDDDQRAVCLHQPIYLAVGEMTDEATAAKLIDACWCQHMWSPIVSKKGAFFCDVAMGIDLALDGPGGWPVEDGWWAKRPPQFQDQVSRYCRDCGMCLPYEQQRLADGAEKISPALYAKFKAANLRNLDDMVVIDRKLAPREVAENACGWEPWHNRQDRTTGEGPAYYNK